ncbi:MAG: hypothetical protein ORN51_04270 [Akkermansiaceae bacterium]|jgi:hypothetical protein|nr:hypothetical protein [Akkermansiaceae bacterium]
MEDTDADGLTNFAEYQNNTDPRDRDTDGDRVPDGWEVQSNGKTVVRMARLKQSATVRFFPLTNSNSSSKTSSSASGLSGEYGGLSGD